MFDVVLSLQGYLLTLDARTAHRPTSAVRQAVLDTALLAIGLSSLDLGDLFSGPCLVCRLILQRICVRSSTDYTSVRHVMIKF